MRELSGEIATLEPKVSAANESDWAGVSSNRATTPGIVRLSERVESATATPPTTTPSTAAAAIHHPRADDRGASEPDCDWDEISSSHFLMSPISRSRWLRSFSRHRRRIPVTGIADG